MAAVTAASAARPGELMPAVQQSFKMTGNIAADNFCTEATTWHDAYQLW
jgi:hypothetical protein